MKRALLLIGVSAAVYAGVVLWAASRLPDTDVALHVNTAGEVNRSASHTGAISYFIGLGTFLLVLAVAVICMCRWIPVRFLNIPHKDYWTAEDRAPIVRRMMVWDMAVILSMTLLALSFIPVNVALMTDDPAASALWVIAPIGVWLIAMAVYTIWMVTRRYRPERR